MSLVEKSSLEQSSLEQIVGSVITNQSEQISQMIVTITEQQKKMSEIMEKQSEQISEMIGTIKEISNRPQKVYKMKRSIYKPEF